MFVEHKEQGEPSRENGAGLDDASKLLLKAADYLEQHPWGNGNHGTDCAYMAMVKADDPTSISTPLSREAGYRFARALGFDMISSIFVWNDEEGRTKEEVVAKLRAVALGG